MKAIDLWVRRSKPITIAVTDWLPVGYLVNFGPKGTLEWKRVILSEFITQTSEGGTKPLICTDDRSQNENNEN
jgi:hypothetical protein